VGFVEGAVFNGTPTVMATKGGWKLVEEAPEGACPIGLGESAEMTIGARGAEEPLYIAGE
jgi:hypothetical protein